MVDPWGRIWAKRIFVIGVLLLIEIACGFMFSVKQQSDFESGQKAIDRLLLGTDSAIDRSDADAALHALFPSGTTVVLPDGRRMVIK